MATVSLMPVPKIQFFSTSGSPLSGGYLYTYYPSTAVPKLTYTDSSASANNTNPIVLDSQGRASVWLDGAYDIELWTGDKTVAGSQLIYTQSNVTSASNQAANVDASQFFVGFSKLTVSDVAPSNPSNNDLWVDIS